MKVLSLFKILLISVFILNITAIKAQYNTHVTVTDIDNPTVKKNMEQSASDLLSDLNQAFFDNKTPSLKVKGLDKEGRASILSMWEMAEFRCIETELIERAYGTPTGYQIRNIPLYLKGFDEDEAYKEIAINFDRNGNIYDIFFTLATHEVYAILNSEDNEVTDLRSRQVILNFVENFRTAYNRKDMSFLQKVYSDDALIITGRVVKVKNNSDSYLKSLPTEKIEYQVKTKKEYLTSLQSVFNNNAKINVVFDEVEVARHPRYDEIYGVTLKQGWYTTNYSDIGYLFLMLDFRDEDNPQIHVRTWQPEKYNGRDIDKDEIFHLGSFDNIIN